jgi:hypothetical protein
MARRTINKIGYTKSEYQFDGNSCGILSAIHEQSGDINRGVDRENEEDQGAGDQGMMFGYATNETSDYMPVSLHLAHLLMRTLADIRREGKVMTYLRPDSKSQVTIEYSDNGVPQRIHTIVVSTQHDEFMDDDEAMLEQIKRDVKEMFSILPFEKEFYEKKHRYPIHYVGNPTAEEVSAFRANYHESFEQFVVRQNGSGTCRMDFRPVIALLAGSRKQEIKDNLPAMIEAAKRFEDYQLVLAGAPSIDDAYYEKFIKGTRVQLVKDQTYELLSHATAALVTSGTATLETALFRVPQVVCYETPLPKLIRFAFNHIIKVPFISLVNLIADREVVKELFADRFRVYRIANELYRVLPGQPGRDKMLQGYEEVAQKLGSDVAPANAARIMVQLLTSNS